MEYNKSCKSLIFLFKVGLRVLNNFLPLTIFYFLRKKQYVDESCIK